MSLYSQKTLTIKELPSPRGNGMVGGWGRAMKEILIKGVTIGLGRNLGLGKFSKIHKIDPSEDF